VRRAFNLILCTVGATSTLLGAAPSTPAVPLAYDAISDRGARDKPDLIHVGPAGFSFNDPVFGSRMWRITDGDTRPAFPGRSYRTPSATHQNAWSAGSEYFYVGASDGTVIPFAFNASTGAAARIQPSRDGDGGLTLRFYIEPQFSYVTPGILFGATNRPGSNLHTIEQYDLKADKYTSLLDLESLVPDLHGTYIGGIASSSGAVERILTFFGGASQDLHHYVVVFDRANPQNRKLLDTRASTIDGAATSTPLGFDLHHAFIDRSGRYVLLYPTGTARAEPRKAAPIYVWDTTSGSITPLPEDTARSGGHDAIGYAALVNQDCCAKTTWDAAQWQARSLATPITSRDLITPVLTPKEVSLADHPTWNNAQPDRLVPFITATYRFGANQGELRPWDDEILAIQSDPPSGLGAEVWRLAHHRSDVRSDTDAAQPAFWYMPRPNVSPDGRWVLFTTNWEKTLGTDPRADAGERARQDVFLLQLTPREVSRGR
jgi:hypothetical protein